MSARATATMSGRMTISSLIIDGKKVVENFSSTFDLAEPGALHVATKQFGWNTRIALVGCGAQKSLHAGKAKDLYTSNLFRAARAYAEATCARWYILSAKFGLLDPERSVAPYENRLQRAGSVGWGCRVGRQLDDAVPYATESGATIICLAGSMYADAIQLPDERELNWEEPLRGLGLGKRIAWLQTNTPQANRKSPEGR